MIGISKCIAEQGQSYFTRDDYHSLEKGEWFGKGALSLGLTGEIQSTHFTNILDGNHPVSGEGLVKNSGNRTADKSKNQTDPIHKKTRERVSYNDLTIAPPKSVSLMAVVDDRIKNAHQAAVQKTLSEIEKNYSLTRYGAKGCKEEITGSVTAACFEHFDSREMDPHLHTHCLVMNMTQRSDGKWGAIENKQILQDQKLLDLMYQSHLIRELHAIGYETRRSTRKGIGGNDVDSFELSCISDDLIDEFSRRTRQVNEFKSRDPEQVERWEKLHRRYEFNEISKESFTIERRKLIEHAKLSTREKKDKKSAEENRPIVHATVAERLAGVPIPREYSDEEKEQRLSSTSQTNSETARTALIETITALEKTESVIDPKALLTQTMRASRGTGVLPEDIQSHIPFYTEQLPSGKLTTPRLKQSALNTVELAESGKMQAGQFVSRGQIESYLKSHESKGVQFSETQRSTIVGLCESRNSVSLLQGNAGTGKTFAVKHIRAILEAEGHLVRGLAPTGKASNGLKGSVSVCSTLDSFFLKDEPIQSGKEIWVVDECSMIGNLHMEKLLKRAEEHRAKVILMGDIKQHQSVSAGRSFWELQQHTTLPIYEMNEVIRQKTVLAKRVVGFSTILKGDNALDLLESHGKVFVSNDAQERADHAVKLYFDSRKRGESAALLTQTNQMRERINTEIRTEHIRQGSISEMRSFQVLSRPRGSGTQLLESNCYKSGMVLIFNSFQNGKDLEGGRVGIESGTEAQIIGVNHEKNEIQIIFKDKKSGQEVAASIGLLQAGNYIQAYEVKEQEFGVGETILFLKNDKKFDVSNGDAGRITAIDPDGKISVDMGDERGCIQFTAKEYPYIDYGYALTNHKAQGATFDTAIVLCDSADRSSAEEWYVGVTRARNEIVVVTDDLEVMKDRVCESKLNDSILEELGMQTWRRESNGAPEIADEPISLPEPQPREQIAKASDSRSFVLPEIVPFETIQAQVRSEIDVLIAENERQDSIARSIAFHKEQERIKAEREQIAAEKRALEEKIRMEEEIRTARLLEEKRQRDIFAQFSKLIVDDLVGKPEFRDMSQRLSYGKIVNSKDAISACSLVRETVDRLGKKYTNVKTAVDQFRNDQIALSTANKIAYDTRNLILKEKELENPHRGPSL